VRAARPLDSAVHEEAHGRHEHHRHHHDARDDDVEHGARQTEDGRRRRRHGVHARQLEVDAVHDERHVQADRVAGRGVGRHAALEQVVAKERERDRHIGGLLFDQL